MSQDETYKRYKHPPIPDCALFDRYRKEFADHCPPWHLTIGARRIFLSDYIDIDEKFIVAGVAYLAWKKECLRINNNMKRDHAILNLLPGEFDDMILNLNEAQRIAAEWLAWAPNINNNTGVIE